MDAWKKVQYLNFYMDTEKKRYSKIQCPNKAAPSASTYQKCLEDYQKFKIPQPPWTAVEKRLIFLYSCYMT